MKALLCRANLLQERIEEPVMLVVRKNLTCGRLVFGIEPGKNQPSRVFMAFQEMCNLILIFLVEHRARCV